MTIPKSASSAGMKLDAALTARLSNAQRSYTLQCDIYEKEYSGTCRERNKEIRDLRRDLAELSFTTGCQGNTNRLERPSTAPAGLRMQQKPLYQSRASSGRPMTATNRIPLRKNINLSVKAGGTQTDVPSPTVLEARRLYQRRQLAKVRRAATTQRKPIITVNYPDSGKTSPVSQHTISSIRSDSRSPSPTITGSSGSSPKLPRRGSSPNRLSPRRSSPLPKRSSPKPSDAPDPEMNSSEIHYESDTKNIETWVHTGRYHETRRKSLPLARHSTPARMSGRGKYDRWLTAPGPNYGTERDTESPGPLVNGCPGTEDSGRNYEVIDVEHSIDHKLASITGGEGNDLPPIEAAGHGGTCNKQDDVDHHTNDKTGLDNGDISSEESEENFDLTPTAIIIRHEEPDEVESSRESAPSTAPRRSSRVSFNDEVTVTSFCDLDSLTGSDVTSNLSELMCEPPGYYKEQRRAQGDEHQLKSQRAHQFRRHSSPDIEMFASHSILKKREGSSTDEESSNATNTRAGWALIRDRLSSSGLSRRHSISDVSHSSHSSHRQPETQEKPGPVKLMKSWNGLRSMNKTMGALKSQMHTAVADLDIKTIPNVGMTSMLNDLNAAVGNQPSRDRRRSISSGMFQPSDHKETAPKAALQRLLRKKSGRRPSATEMRMFERRPSMRLLRMMNAQNQNRSTAEMLEMQRNRAAAVATPIEELWEYSTIADDDTTLFS